MSTTPNEVVRDQPPRVWGAGEWLGLAGIIVGIAVSLFFWWLSEKTKDLTFAVSPTRPQIVRSGLASDVKSFYKGVEITGNLSVIQLAVWNQGRDPIRGPEDILRQVTITPATGMKILEAKIVKTTRDEIGFLLSPQNADGAFGLNWRILERGDGALIQLFVVDAPDSPLTVAGTVVGQGALGTHSIRQEIAKTDTPSKSFTEAYQAARKFVLVMVFGAWIWTIADVVRTSRRHSFAVAMRKHGFFTVLCLLVSLLVARKEFIPTPFGF